MKVFRTPLCISVSLLALAACAPLAATGVIATGGTGVGLTGGPAGAIRPIVNQLVITTSEIRELTSLLRNEAGLIPTQAVTWASSDSTVASVDPATGKVVGQRAGTAILTATTLGPGGTPSVVRIEVQVMEKHVVKHMQISPPTTGLVLGESRKLTAQVFMADGQINGNVQWSSSDDTIASVNGTSGQVSAHKEGRVTIVAAYTLDPRYKAVADVTIVKDASQLPPSPAASDIVFGPSSTPLPVTAPSPSLLPSPEPERSADSEPGTVGLATPEPTPTPVPTPTPPPSTQYNKPAAVKITNTGLSPLSIAFFLDYEHVFVAGGENGTSIAYSQNAGKSWSVLKNIGSNQITSMFWIDENTGYIGGPNGTILKVDLESKSFEVQDSGTTYQITNIEFSNTQTGYATSHYGPFIKTDDGGESWHEIPKEGAANELASDGLGGVAFLGYDGLWRYNSGQLRQIKLSGGQEQFDYIESVDGRAIIGQTGNAGMTWSTNDWETFSPINDDLRTSTQIIRGRTSRIVMIDKDTWLREVNNGISITKNAGRLWSDPSESDSTAGFRAGERRAFGADRLWQFASGELYRHGK